MVSTNALRAHTAPKTHIIAQATPLFVQRGYHGISMREVAAAAGVSKAGLYYHFQDKEALFVAILTEHVEQLAQRIRHARQEPTTRQRIAALMRAILAHAPEQRAIIRLATQEMGELSEAARAEFGRLYHDRFIGQVVAIVQDGIAQGELRPIDAYQTAWVLLGMMFPFLYPSQERALDDLDATVDLMLTIFLQGVGCTP